MSEISIFDGLKGKGGRSPIVDVTDPYDLGIPRGLGGGKFSSGTTGLLMVLVGAVGIAALGAAGLAYLNQIKDSLHFQ